MGGAGQESDQLGGVLLQAVIDHRSVATPSMAAPDPQEVIMRLSLAVVGVGAAAAALWAIENAKIKNWTTPPFVDFEQLWTHLESKPNKKDVVNVQGTILREEDKCVRSGKGEVEGVARRVTSNGFWRGRGDLCTNLSVSFLLRDSEANTIRVLDVHDANGLDSVMQLVSSDRQYREKILTFDARVWLRGCARIEGDTILINPAEICGEIL